MLQVVQQIPEALGNGTSVALLGGEPLFMPWSIPLAAEIVKLGLRLTIFTNGVPLANPSLAAQTAPLIHAGAQVRVSLSGPTRQTCDTLAGAGRFEAALAGIHRLAALGCQATVDLMFLPQQVDAIARHLPELRRRLPQGTPLTFGVLYLSGREVGQHLFASRSELDAALDRVAFEAGEVVPATRTSPTAYRREGCGCALGNHIHVRSDGALFNCFKMEEKIGHLNTIEFTAAVEYSREHPHFARELPTCAACPLATLCGGGCRSENLLYSGDAGAPPCGPWRVRVLSELLAEDRVTAVEWPLAFLLHEARQRGIEAPTGLLPRQPSRHLLEV
jgi:radical SAM protein with 4Fe4S-binding SPASM domain